MKWQQFGHRPRGKRVQKSGEWQRINDLPRRCPEERAEELVKLYTRAYKTPKGQQWLFPQQARTLFEIEMHGGALGGLGVGEGKTLVSLLAPQVAKARRAVLILPAKLIPKTEREFAHYAEHWDVPSPRLISYEKLGRVQYADYLDKLQPDLIIADEAHRLKNKKAAVTRRVMRYIRKHSPRCVFLGASFTTKSLHDYWHLAKVCLPELPMPRMWPELSEWADAIDDKVPDDMRVGPGALLEWGPPDEPDPVKRARLGYQSRLRETDGVVITRAGGCQASLQITLRRITPPPEVVDALAGIRTTWERPDGYAFADNLSLFNYLRQVALGFFYEPTTPAPPAWLDARRRWAGFVRDTINRSRKWDSELAVALAVRTAELPDPDDALAKWHAIKDSYVYGTRPVWISNFAIDAISLTDPTLVWCEHVSFAEKLAQSHGICYYGRMGMSSEGHPIETESSHRSAVLSIAANAEGRNLQAWCRNVIMGPPGNGAVWEQLLGRTHRVGQQSDTVESEVIITSPEHEDSWQSAVENARYLQDSTGLKQKLLLADVT